LALVLWVVRVPAAATVLGLLILGGAPQAQDLFVEFGRQPPYRIFKIVYFLVVLVAVWAMPTHYAARLLLNTDRRFQDFVNTKQASNCSTCLDASIIWVPRLLGLFTFGAVLIAIWRSHSNLPVLDQVEVIEAINFWLAVMAILVILSGLAFFYYVRYRPRGARLPRFLRMEAFWRLMSPGRSRDSDDELSRDLGRLLLLAMFAIFVSIFWLGADRVGHFFPRALAIPFILGGWLPFLSYLSAVGRQARAPLIAGVFLVTALLVVVLGDNHSVRRIDADRKAGQFVDRKPLPLQEAVSQWMTENQCNPASGNLGNAATCPRPIIIAAAGGASRAAFFMATVIGYFMQQDEAAKRGLDPNQVRNRLFAISGVSGGSVGAVMVTAALNAKNDSNELPCVRTSVDQWWGQTINNWRDCFEALTSGDFLTADFFGLTFNDMLPLGFWRDRAAVLEDSWRNRYRDVVTHADKSTTPPLCEGLDCPFLTLRPRPGHWIPLLVLNGTSEATGGRIMTTILASTYTPTVACPTADVNVPSHCPLFVQADRFHDLLDAEVTSDGWSGWFGGLERYLLRAESGNDVRLSTAAHNSARFPLISPPGTVRRNQDQAIVDRIVDGGYFENYGALGAKELALAVHAVQPQLAPLVIVISNDPDDLLDSSDDSSPPAIKETLQKQLSRKVEKTRAQVSGVELVTDITTLLTTIANDRTAHGVLGVDQLHSTLRAAIPECDLLIKVRVWPQNGRSLSMSWWESSPVQRQLHRQTEPRKEKNENGPHLEAIWTLMKATSSCATAKQ
jgi:hypothetical protein